MKDKVSVIIPTYNRKEELLRAINSVLEQTYNYYEIIVVDDNSNFSVKDFLIKYLSESFRIIRNERNLGPSSSRNIGVNNATGVLVAFLDSDDYWDKEKLKKQIQLFNNDPSIGLIYCDQWIVDNKNNIIPSRKKIITDNLWDNLLNWWTSPNTSTLMFRKDVFISLGGFDNRLMNCEDHDLWMNVAKNNIIFKGINEQLSYFNQSNSERLTFDYKRRFDGVKKFLSKWKGDIINSKGIMHFLWFKNIYKLNAALPIFMILLRKRQFKNALIVFVKNLLCNPFFYSHVFKSFINLVKV
ncbi:MAG: glycosyltransferase family 2 protein [Bacteroidales bacterium]|nr:glycosyltransferase family 2 protein [Bacteroidales bacterium]